MIGVIDNAVASLTTAANMFKCLGFTCEIAADSEKFNKCVLVWLAELDIVWFKPMPLGPVDEPR